MTFGPSGPKGLQISSVLLDQGLWYCGQAVSPQLHEAWCLLLGTEQAPAGNCSTPYAAPCNCCILDLTCRLPQQQYKGPLIQARGVDPALREVGTWAIQLD